MESSKIVPGIPPSNFIMLNSEDGSGAPEICTTDGKLLTFVSPVTYTLHLKGAL
jgi:hypothetical protein